MHTLTAEFTTAVFPVSPSVNNVIN